jgi:8-oxo-dGTP pyrophosphatase MutT (NUDIX family)
MAVEHSYGIVPLRKRKGAWHVLLVQHGSAHYWGFPKGHGEKGESPEQAALRELREETNLEVVRFLTETVLEEHYHFTHNGRHIEKTVSFFVAEVKGTVRIQAAEIGASKWVPLESASDHVTYGNDKAICHQVIALI